MMVGTNPKDKLVLATILQTIFNFELVEGRVQTYKHPSGLHVCLSGQSGLPFAYKQCDQIFLIKTDTVRILPVDGYWEFTYNPKYPGVYLIFKIKHKRID